MDCGTEVIRLRLPLSIFRSRFSCLLFALLSSTAISAERNVHHHSNALRLLDIPLSVYRPHRLFRSAMALETQYCHDDGDSDGNEDTEPMHHDEGERFRVRDI